MDTSDLDSTDPLRCALAAHLGESAAAKLLTKFENYSNLPNAIKGAAKFDSDPDLEAAALQLIEDPALAEALGFEGAAEDNIFGFGPTQEGWALLTLAARTDSGVLDRVADKTTGDSAPRHLATIRRAATKHAASLASAPPADASATSADAGTNPAAQGGPEVPAKVSEVKGWLAAHPGVDPAVLAPRAGQKAAARVSAIRALGTMGSPEALAVLGQYADDRYPDAVLAELHKAWGAFDRRDFAATMFRQAPHTLDLGMGPSLEGIGAVPDLTSLDVVLTGEADLTPLAECAGLRTLRVGAEELPGLVDVTPLRALLELTELHLTRTTRGADLTPLADLGVQRLRIDLDGADGTFLLDMQPLERVLISGGTGPDDRTADHEVPPLAPHPGLGEVVLQLIRKGVEVIVWKHQQTWVAPLLAAAGAAADVFTVEAGGRIGLTVQERALEGLGRRISDNRLP